MKKYTLTTWILFLTLFFATTSIAQDNRSTHPIDGEWTVLGSRHIKRSVDRDVIAVGLKEGGFTKLKVKVTGGRVNMHRMIVTYGNGQREEIRLRQTFRRGSTSRIIDINGRKRIIKNISFVYDRNNLSRKARIWVGAKK